MTEELHHFPTPGGHDAAIWCRPGTNDRMVAESVIQSDEYELRDCPEGALYIDIGAHIGAWTVAALLDGKAGHVVAVEPLTPNCDLMERNLIQNGVHDRATVTRAAFAKRGPMTVRWDFEATGSELAETAAMHRFIGNQRMPETPDLVLKRPEIRAQEEKVAVITPSKLFAHGPDVVKIDCEGGEVALIGARLAGVGIITGEYHFQRDELIAHLSKTHDVHVEGEPTFGKFRAVPRA